MIKLRDYQEDCIDKIMNCEQGSKVCVSIATGGGKTCCMSGLVNKIYDTGARVMIVVPSTELREQTIDKLHMTCGDDIDVGSVQANLNEYDKQIIVATRQSLTSQKSTRFDDLKSCGEFDYIIIDECHVACLQQKKIIDMFDNGITKFIGFTATPYNEEMRSIYNGIIYNKSIMDMILMKYLVEPRCKLVYSNTDISNVSTVAGEFNLGQLENCINNDNRNQLIVDAYNKYLSDRKKTLIFATGIDHANAICDCFNSNGIKAYSVDSTDTKEDRDRIIDDFRHNKIKVLINVGILTIGFDVPDLDSIILARPTKSKMLYTQIIGRGLRTSNGKKDCLIIDVVDVARQHNIMSMSNIFNTDIKDGETPLEAKKRIAKTKEEERLRLEEKQRQRELEEKRKQELIAREIELFNSSMKNILVFSTLDWFKFDDKTYSLMGDTIHSCTIRKTNDNEFIVYVGTTEKYKLSLEEDTITNNLQEAISICEDKMRQYGTSFMKRDTRWKNDAATPNQLKMFKPTQLKYIKTKWNANTSIFNKRLYFEIKNLEQN